ncbi:TPA: phosphoglycerate mutase [candidate division WOR-3 bacterium]|uniref:Phosphoglycerate mutase n=1 Tax=candidate division WOR-3 bacterium TaxID=2052148 RepID=A0A350H8L5_UNCW3|nr:phosphoglycerate mutase [candidate division WOR-3 bacterium]
MKEVLFRELLNPNESKLLLIVLDGVGGLPDKSGMTELETAFKPNLDKLAKENETGDMIPVDIGITPGSGPGHLGVFGYEPSDYPIGRGILEALGLNINVDKETVTVRCNFATMDVNHVIIDRRAGRISSEENQRLVEKLKERIKNADGKKIEFYAGKEHRFVLVIRGVKGNADVNDTDPQEIGKKPIEAKPNNESSKECAEIINKVYAMIVEALKDEPKANTALFRGISKMPDIPTMEEKYMLNPCCIATYPMYKGLATLVGMKILKTGETIEDQIETLKDNYEKYDFFFFHVKKTDSYGEDGDFAKKVKVIENFDSLLPKILDLKFDVIAITADHSTPSVMMSHSHHPVPLLLIGKHSRKSDAEKFTERECLKGAIKRIYSKQLMPLMLASSGRLKKFGA